MDSLDIEPYGKLVRVGGQSKVEEIDQFNIRNVRDEYLKRRQFDSDYAALRLRTKHILLLLQNYRSDLKSLFTDLCDSHGIANLWKLREQIRNEEISIGRPFFANIEAVLVPIFFSRSGSTVFDFLGLNNFEFESDQFSAEAFLKRWFDVRLASVATKKVTKVVKEAETLVTEFEDKELRDILVAHRLEEEILEEKVSHKAQVLDYLLCEQDESKFSSLATKLFAELSDAELQREFKMVRRLQGELFHLGLQRDKFLRQSDFVAKLHKYHRDGQLKLPVISPEWFAEKTSIWRTSLSEKWALYFYVIDAVKKHLLTEIVKIEANIIDAQKNMEDVKNKGDGLILQAAMVVGMTTTGAAKYNTVLRMMESKIGTQFSLLDKDRHSTT